MFQLIQLYFKKKKTIVSFRNCGFGDNLFSASSAYLYAKQTGRDLLICWSYSRYLTNKQQNAFHYFFSVPDVIDGVKIIKLTKVDFSLLLMSMYVPAVVLSICSKLHKMFSGNKTNIFTKLRINMMTPIAVREKKLIAQELHTNQKVVFFRECLLTDEKQVMPFFDALRPNPELESEIDAFVTEHFNKKIIGVHIRYYNKNLPFSDHTSFWLNEDEGLRIIGRKIQEAIEKIEDGQYSIFLATDGEIPFRYVTQHFKNVITYKKIFGKQIDQELHEELPRETANATIVEMFLLAKTDILIRYPPHSWFSRFASLYVNQNS